MTTTTKPTASVLITTEYRGIFWGWLEATRDGGRTVVLTGARSAIYWGTTHGFLELAQIGPNSKSRIGARADRITLYEVTSMTECTPEATAAWEAR